MNKPNLDFSPADSRQRPAPSLASLTRTPIFGPHAVAFGVLQDEVDFLEVLHHRNDGAAELGGDHDRFDVAVVLEAVADHEAVGRILGDGHAPRAAPAWSRLRDRSRIPCRSGRPPRPPGAAD